MREEISIGDHFTLTLHRTLRIPHDGTPYPLPASLGAFPIYTRLEVPRASSGDFPEADYYVPMYQCEALWFSFRVPYWLSHAVQIAVGGSDVLTGEPSTGSLSASPQNYLVCPRQPSLDVIRAAPGVLRQLVTPPAGECEVTIRLIPPKPGRFRPDSDEPPGLLYSRKAPKLALGGGSRIKQKLYPDPHGIEVWDESRAQEIRIQILNSASFVAFTGIAVPPTPVTVEQYARHGLPWFGFYEETDAGEMGAPSLTGVQFKH